MKPCLFILCLFTVNCLSAQTDTTKEEIIRTPYNPAASYQAFGIKAHVIPLPIGNQGTLANLLGFDWGFHRNQSIGIDAVFNYTEGSHDDVYDTSGVHHDVGAYYHTTELALLLNYRFYLKFPRLRVRKGIVPYLGSFLRYGHMAGYQDPAYTVYSDDFNTRMETDYSAGILLGFLSRFEGAKHAGIDFNIGVFEKEKHIVSAYKGNNVTNATTNNMGIKMDLNVYWWFFRNNTNR